jgi:hypothetical protein
LALLKDYPEMGIYVKTEGIPSVKYENGKWLYFLYVLDEHRSILLNYGAKFELKEI